MIEKYCCKKIKNYASAFAFILLFSVHVNVSIAQWMADVPLTNEPLSSETRLNALNNNQFPNSYSLSQNYPNPFNPSTNIKFSIPEYSFVKITVHDIPGREISCIVNEYKASGFYNVSFDASGLPSGVYFYSIETTNYSESKKMLLIK